MSTGTRYFMGHLIAVTLANRPLKRQTVIPAVFAGRGFGSLRSVGVESSEQHEIDRNVLLSS